MFKNSKIASAVRLTMVAGLATSAFTINTATAQEAGADGAEVAERISVTGSRIQRAEFESATPIASFDADDIAKAGVTSVDEFLKFIPATSGFQLGATTNNGNDGAKKIDVRGIGFNRTLILINGKRTIGDVNGDGAVDLNQVPMSMVKRIDVLKGGASTIYGTDAIAGVVNIILQEDFEGVKLGANYVAGTEGWDAEQKVVSFLMGTSSDRGSITVAMEYNNQDELKQGERDWAHDALWPSAQYDDAGNLTGFVPVASGSSNSRTMRLNDAQRDAIVAAGGPRSSNWIVDATTGEVRPFAATDVYNYAPVNALITPNERFQFALNAKYDLTDTTTAYMDALYTQRDSLQRLAPDASFGRDPVYQLVWDNPFNPFNDAASNPWGVDFSSSSNDAARASATDLEGIFINRRFTESGGRLFSQKANTFRMLAGVRGEFDNDIFWDLSYTHAYNEQLDNTQFYHRKDRWQTIVNEAACNATPACAAVGTINPFADFGAITDEQMAYLVANSLKDYYNGELSHFSATLSGDGFELPGGLIGWAAGYENRSEEGEFIPDEFAAGGLTTSGASDPQQGSFRVDEVYVESYLPFMDNLAVEAALRYSDYSTSAGSKFDSLNYKIAVDFDATEDLKFRAVVASGFRAPNISEMNQQQTTGFPTVDNICEFVDRRTDLTETQKANCLADGFTGELGFAWQAGYTTEAPDQGTLIPEESVTTNVGIVYNLPLEQRVSVSLDYWSIEIENLIGATDYQLLFNDCMDSVGYTAASCVAFDGGNPLAGGLPADATYSFGNVGELDVSGIDFEFDTRFELESDFADSLGVRFSGTYYIERIERWVELGFERDMIGKAYTFEVYPELKTTMSFNLTGGDWNLFWDIRYVDETVDALRPATVTDDNIADSVLYHDLSGNYTFGSVTVGVGITNLLDKDAPRYHSGFNANTAPGTYDTIGRKLFANVTVDF